MSHRNSFKRQTRKFNHFLANRYLIEIAKIYNIEYEPDPHVMLEASRPAGPDFDMLIDLQDRNNLGGGGPAPPMGFVGFPQPPALPVMPQPPSHVPFNYPQPGNSSGGASAGYQAPPFNYNIPAYPPLDQEKNDLDTHFQSVCIHRKFILVLGFSTPIFS